MDERSTKRRCWRGNIEAAGNALQSGQCFEESIDVAARTVLPSALSPYYFKSYRVLCVLSKVWLSKSEPAVAVLSSVMMKLRTNYS